MSTRCPKCGSTFGDQARYCPKDGWKLLTVTTDPRPKAPTSGVDASRTHARVMEAISTKGRGGSGLPPAPPGLGDLTGELLDGRYRVAKKIGEGGMSFVYLAHDTAGGERVAIKILSPSLLREQNAMARLRREAELAGKLAHPNVCHIIRLGETDGGLVYVVMPFVEGELLCDRTLRDDHLSLDLTVSFVHDIAAGLEVAHRLGIIHRDLKPENIMICRRPDGGERAVVMDFGLAKERRVDPEVQKLTATGVVLGTPEFMSPEQLRGKPLDARSDLYALALMTYEMLTGKLPFSGRTQQEIMIARLKSEPMPLRAIRPELSLSAAVEKVLLRALARDPGGRFPSAVDYATELARAARDGDAPASDGGRLTRGSGGSFIDRLLGRR